MDILKILEIAWKAAQKLDVEYGCKTVSPRHEYDQLISIKREIADTYYQITGTTLP